MPHLAALLTRGLDGLGEARENLTSYARGGLLRRKFPMTSAGSRATQDMRGIQWQA